MSDSKSHRFILLVILIASLLFAIMEFFGLQFQVYLWEFLISPKYIFLLIITFLLIKNDKGYFATIINDIKRIRWKNLLVWLTMPLLLLSVVIFIGEIGSQIENHNFENWPTKSLQILFDFPALLFFSMSSIFVEELFFRSIFIKKWKVYAGLLKAVLLQSIFWLIFSLSEFLFLAPFSIENILVNTVHFLSTGLLLGVLVVKYDHIIYGYLFRVGLLSYGTILLSSANHDQSTFFVSNSIVYGSQGTVFSVLSVGLAIFLIIDCHRNGLKTKDF